MESSCAACGGCSDGNDLIYRRRFAIKRLTWVSSGALCISIFILFAVTAWGQQKSIAKGAVAVGPKPLFLLSISQSRSIPDGIELHSGTAIIQVVALRDDVLRVRVGVSGELPEDASWAVLSNARTHRVEVESERSTDTVGFTTHSLRVQFRLSDSRLKVLDLAGNVLQEDAFGWPEEFHGDAFRIYKRMPDDEHYFGLGDKAGPLDRRNQAFTLWNSDIYSFQESTDPIYKSIPFFLTFRQGRTCGVLETNLAADF